MARRPLTPWWGVELTGWGYYMERRWREVHDDLQATALVIDDGRRPVALVALDLMVIDGRFTEETRRRIHAATGLPPESILLTCSHTHSAPSAGGLRGVGACDPDYEEWASRQAATAAILAWNGRCETRLAWAEAHLEGITFNRTRDDGPVDTTLTTLRVDRADGSPLAVVVNFQAHPTVSTILRSHAVSRDVPGEVCDLVEAALPGATALYVQGACGDVNFLPDYSTADRCRIPAEMLARAALRSHDEARVVAHPSLGALRREVEIPTRRWRREEIYSLRDEAQRRLATNDIIGWRESIGRVMTNRPDDMVARHGGDEVEAVRAMARFFIEWSDEALRDWETRPETLRTEVQALRLGELYIAANSSELFTSLALDLRRQIDAPLMLACYSNGRIGYVPDAHDVRARSYAAYQSPKYCDQFPFTETSGQVLCAAMEHAVLSLREAP